MTAVRSSALQRDLRVSCPHSFSALRCSDSPQSLDASIQSADLPQDVTDQSSQVWCWLCIASRVSANKLGPAVNCRSGSGSMATQAVHAYSTCEDFRAHDFTVTSATSNKKGCISSVCAGSYIKVADLLRSVERHSPSRSSSKLLIM
jgi:hypothetical protein